MTKIIESALLLNGYKPVGKKLKKNQLYTHSERLKAFFTALAKLTFKADISSFNAWKKRRWP